MEDDKITFNQGTLLLGVVGLFLLGLITTLDGCQNTSYRHNLLRDCIRGKDAYAQKVDAEVCKHLLELELGKK